MEGCTVCNNITLTFCFYETFQERSVLRRLIGNKMNWYDIAQPSGNGRRVNKMMADGLAVNIKTIKAI